MPKAIKESEVVDELRRLSQRTDAGFTVAEWAEEIGKGVNLARAMLKKAQKLGWLVHGKQTRTSELDGRVYLASVYRLVPPPQRKGLK